MKNNSYLGPNWMWLSRRKEIIGHRFVSEVGGVVIRKQEMRREMERQ